MSQDNPFLHIKSRSIILWVILSIPALFLGSVLIGVLWGLITLFNDLEFDASFSKDPLFILIVSNTWIYSLMIFWCLRQIKRSHLSIKRIIGKLPNNRQWLGLLCLVVPILLFSLGSGQMIYYLLSYVAPKIIETSLQQKLFLSSSETSLPLLYNSLTIISLVVIAPLVEEILFRGIILQRWAVKWGLTPAVIISSLVFGVLHFNLIGLSVFGIMMALLYIKIRTLIIPIICHALNNSAVVIFSLLPIIFNSKETVYTIEQVQSSWSVGIFYLVISAPLLILFIYKNWPNKHDCAPYFTN
ncbi:MAG: CPBP family intramembrane metalloprotease [Moorea sp. SIO2B7]|nr:CPBP family intramembrane metalloprotease [Moorena sp. SIO2B7]